MKYIVFALLTLSIISCHVPRYVYAPVRVNTPLFQQKKEIQLDGSIPVLRGFDASAAYSPISHLGLMINSSWRNDHEKWTPTDYELLNPLSIQYHRSSFDFGVGWYSRIGESNWCVEIFSGIGKGNFSIDENGYVDDNGNRLTYTRHYDSKLSRFFIQPEIGSNPNSPVQFVVFTRFLFQNYYGIQTDYSQHEMDYYYIPNGATSRLNFIEPGFTFRFYIPSVDVIGFETNFLLSNETGGSSSTIPIHISFGIHSRFYATHKTKKS